MSKVSVIMPVLDEAAGIGAALRALPSAFESVVVDGGSTDQTAEIALPLANHLLASTPGRGVQMNAGAAVATGDILVFLHADTRLPADCDGRLQEFAASGRQWGRFDVRLDDPHPAFRMIETMMNLRSRLTGIATGDQAIFVRRDVFQAVGGFADIPLMEDIELSGRLRSRAWPLCLGSPVVTSARRWRQYGILRTIGLMWRLRLRFFLGTPPEELARAYGR